MRDEDKEIIKLTAKEVFFTLFDIPVAMTGTFDKYRMYRKSIREYFKERKIDRTNFRQKLYYLKQKKLINIFVEDKEKYIEITKKGYEELSWHKVGKDINTNNRWDGKWRLVIFDVPEDKRDKRNVIREKLEEIGFLAIQKSVYVYPFECKNEFDMINYFVGSRFYMKYMVAEIIEGEQDIIRAFMKKKILTKKDLNVTKSRRSS